MSEHDEQMMMSSMCVGRQFVYNALRSCVTVVSRADHRWGGAGAPSVKGEVERKGSATGTIGDGPTASAVSSPRACAVRDRLPVAARHARVGAGKAESSETGTGTGLVGSASGATAVPAPAVDGGHETKETFEQGLLAAVRFYGHGGMYWWLD